MKRIILKLYISLVRRSSKSARISAKCNVLRSVFAFSLRHSDLLHRFCCTEIDFCCLETFALTRTFVGRYVKNEMKYQEIRLKKSLGMFRCIIQRERERDRYTLGYGGEENEATVSEAN